MKQLTFCFFLNALAMLSTGLACAQSPAGSAKVAKLYSNGQSNLPPDMLGPLERGGEYIVSIGDVNGDGVTDLAMSSKNHPLLGTVHPCGAWILFPNRQGEILQATKIENGVGVLPSGLFADADLVGYNVAGLGDVNNDGVPDIALSARGKDNKTGGAWILFLNEDGIPIEAHLFDKNHPSVPAQRMNAGDEVGAGIWPLGDIDGNGAPDLLLGAPGFDSSPSEIDSGGCWIAFLSPTGIASSVQLANGVNDVPPGFFTNNRTGYKVSTAGYINNDNTVDILLSGSTSAGGGPYLIMLNPNGTCNLAKKLAPGNSGIPTGTPFGSPYFMVGMGDVDGNGVPDIAMSDINSCWVLRMTATGDVLDPVRIANGMNGVPPGTFPSAIGSPVTGGTRYVAALGDVDENGVPDLAMGCGHLTDPQSGDETGGVFIILLNNQGQAIGVQKLVNGLNGIPANSFQVNDAVGKSVSPGGDLNNDGIPDLLVGAYLMNDRGDDKREYVGGSWFIGLKGASPRAYGAMKFANGHAGLAADVLPANSSFGTAADFVGDADGDGIGDIVVGMRGDARILHLNEDKTVKAFLSLGTTSNWPVPDTNPVGVSFGTNVRGLGDLDNDGINDIIVSAPNYYQYYPNGGASLGGAVFIFRMAADGSIKACTKLFDGFNGVGMPLPGGGTSPGFGVGTGRAINVIPDIDGDGQVDLVLGSLFGSVDRVVLLNADGSAKAVHVVDPANFGVGGPWYKSHCLELIGDIDGDAAPDYAAGDAGGRVLITKLNANGTPKSMVKLTAGVNGLPANATASTRFGRSITSVGDMDNDGTPDMVVSGPQRDGGRGGAWILHLNPTGTVKTYAEIADGINGIPAGTFQAGDGVGSHITVVPGLNPLSAKTILLSAPGIDANGTDSGGFFAVTLNASSQVASVKKFCNGSAGLSANTFNALSLAGQFIAPGGDFNGDGIRDLLISTILSDDYTNDSGAVWLLEME